MYILHQPAPASGSVMRPLVCRGPPAPSPFLAGALLPVHSQPTQCHTGSDLLELWTSSNSQFKKGVNQHDLLNICCTKIWFKSDYDLNISFVLENRGFRISFWSTIFLMTGTVACSCQRWLMRFYLNGV